LIREGAKLVETAEHILEEVAKTLEFQLELPDISKAEKTEKGHQADSQIDADYQKVLDLMGYDPISVDGLVVQTGLTAEELSSILLMLELQGLVASSGGGSYTRLAQ